MPESSPTLMTPAQRRGNQIKLLVLWLVPIGLMAIAGICYYLVQTGQLNIGSKNHGALLQPPLQLHELLPEAQHLDVTGHALEAGSLWQGKWTLVVRGGVGGQQACDNRCQENLYLTRQLHIRLDKHANRVQRVLLSPLGQAPNKDAALSEFLQREHRLAKYYVAGETNLARLDAALRSGAGEAARFFIVDPAGWAMMYYLDEHNGNAMLKDLKHLLKYSRAR